MYAFLCVVVRSVASEDGHTLHEASSHAGVTVNPMVYRMDMDIDGDDNAQATLVAQPMHDSIIEPGTSSSPSLPLESGSELEYGNQNVHADGDHHVLHSLEGASQSSDRNEDEDEDVDEDEDEDEDENENSTLFSIQAPSTPKVHSASRELLLQDLAPLSARSSWSSPTNAQHPNQRSRQPRSSSASSGTSPSSSSTSTRNVSVNGSHGQLKKTRTKSSVYDEYPVVDYYDEDPEHEDGAEEEGGVANEEDSYLGSFYAAASVHLSDGEQVEGESEEDEKMFNKLKADVHNSSGHIIQMVQAEGNDEVDRSVVSSIRMFFDDDDEDAEVDLEGVHKAVSDVVNEVEVFDDNVSLLSEPSGIHHDIHNKQPVSSVFSSAASSPMKHALRAPPRSPPLSTSSTSSAERSDNYHDPKHGRSDDRNDSSVDSRPFIPRYHDKDSRLPQTTSGNNFNGKVHSVHPQSVATTHDHEEAEDEAEVSCQPLINDVFSPAYTLASPTSSFPHHLLPHEEVTEETSRDLLLLDLDAFVLLLYRHISSHYPSLEAGNEAADEEMREARVVQVFRRSLEILLQALAERVERLLSAIAASGTTSTEVTLRTPLVSVAMHDRRGLRRQRWIRTSLRSPSFTPAEGESEEVRADGRTGSSAPYASNIEVASMEFAREVAMFCPQMLVRHHQKAVADSDSRELRSRRVAHVLSKRLAHLLGAFIEAEFEEVFVGHYLGGGQGGALQQLWRRRGGVLGSGRGGVRGGGEEAQDVESARLHLLDVLHALPADHTHPRRHRSHQRPVRVVVVSCSAHWPFISQFHSRSALLSYRTSSRTPGVQGGAQGGALHVSSASNLHVTHRRWQQLLSTFADAAVPSSARQRTQTADKKQKAAKALSVRFEALDDAGLRVLDPW